MTLITRRGFVSGVLAAPLVVKAGVLMPVKPVVPVWYKVSGYTYSTDALITVTEEWVAGYPTYPLSAFGWRTI